MNKRYPSDMTDDQWERLEPIFCIESTLGRPRDVDMREVLNAIFYISKSGCQWGMLPKEFPPKSTVFYYFDKFTKDGSFIESNRVLREESRVKMGRDKHPTAVVIDSQSSKSINIVQGIGYDGGKSINGRKRHIGVDVVGHLMGCKIHAANISDRVGAKMLLKILTLFFFQLKIIFADGGYSGKPLRDWVMVCFGWILKIMIRPQKNSRLLNSDGV
jgi:putative transposase